MKADEVRLYALRGCFLKQSVCYTHFHSNKVFRGDLILYIIIENRMNHPFLMQIALEKVVVPCPVFLQKHLTKPFMRCIILLYRVICTAIKSQMR